VGERKCGAVRGRGRVFVENLVGSLVSMRAIRCDSGVGTNASARLYTHHHKHAKIEYQRRHTCIHTNTHTNTNTNIYTHTNSNIPHTRTHAQTYVHIYTRTHTQLKHLTRSYGAGVFVKEGTTYREEENSKV